MKSQRRVVPLTKAQKYLPALCRSGKSFLITTRDVPTSVLLPIGDYEALMETMELLSNPKAMKVLRAAKAGELNYKELDLNNKDLGL